ncbi:sensor histidine kinase [Schaalia sp. lx-100]|uniref:sensor histidine kinase n=1 Tax=Schaalia sp. lx-100 TaxID=2899081 RepID=UPI001E5B908E|nr:HAMP domain-containing histidine kinase [Schaalia sp. lx-100]
MFPSRIRQIWEAKPLATRLVTLIVVLLASGLLLTGTIMIGLLQRHLVSQIDEQLVTSARSMAEQTSRISDSHDAMLPSLFYIRRSIVGRTDEEHYSPDTLEHSGTPIIPTLLQPGERAETANGWTSPVTVESTHEGTPWRAIAVPLVTSGTHSPVGVMTIALPLADVQHTLRNTALYIIYTSLGIIICGGALGRYLVRRTFLPLREIESTAGKIAAGDLTQRIRSQPSTTEVGSLALSLNTMLSQVEQSFSARKRTERKIRRFVSDASHELRTPLAAISGYCELYAMGGVSQERTPEVMGRIQSESARMASLVEDLLTLARLDEGRALEFTSVDLRKMADNAAFDLQALDPERSVSLISFKSKNPPMSLVVEGDRDRLQQVFTNLVGNIIRYTPQGSPVELALGLHDDYAVVEFRDHGPGVASQERDKVFERFYRTENSRSRSLGGSGLGLAIVSGILNAHHGTAALSKTQGGGLTVRITLPLRQPVKHGVSADNARTPAQASSVPSLSVPPATSRGPDTDMKFT